MAKTELTARERLKQELRTHGSALVNQLEAGRASKYNGDLEALRIIAEGAGTCRFKVKDWSDPVTMNGVDKDTALLQTFLLLLWQHSSLEKASYDPVDLRVARENHSAEQSVVILPNVQEHEVSIAGMEEIVQDEDANTKDPSQDVFLADDGTNYLVGPREINLKRKDIYHPLFSNYRNSAATRQYNFLASKHLLHIRKLSGIDVNDFGYKFCRAVLEKAAPSLEELYIRHYRVDEMDLYLDLQFPNLHRLYIWMDERGNIQDELNFQFPPPLHDNIGLRWLCARLPRLQLESLLRHNAKTLMELQLQVGTCSSHPPAWPMQCNDLEVLLVSCGVGTGNLRKLKLIRGAGSNHTRTDCEMQVEAVRCSLPGVGVTCDKCCISDKSCGVDFSMEYNYPRGAWDDIH